MTRINVESPCIRVCRLNARNVCDGCGRTLDEIGEWSAASEQRQREIVAAARARLAMRGQPRRNDFAFFLKLAPRWGDMDALGHVNNAKFFTYDESVRLDYFQRLMSGDAKFWNEYGLILAHIEADFIAQLKPPAELDIGFRIAKIGRSSLGTEAAMFRGEQLIAVTRGVLVWFDYRAGTPLPVPDEVKAKIRGVEKVPPVAN
jgi:acyl-CoA thioester hydrolase